MWSRRGCIEAFNVSDFFFAKTDSTIKVSELRREVVVYHCFPHWASSTKTYHYTKPAEIHIMQLHKLHFYIIYYGNCLVKSTNFRESDSDQCCHLYLWCFHISATCKGCDRISKNTCHVQKNVKSESPTVSYSLMWLLYTVALFFSKRSQTEYQR